jgi:Tat protein secretion system quality control protein TatD with DNase activity
MIKSLRKAINTALMAEEGLDYRWNLLSTGRQDLVFEEHLTIEEIEHLNERYYKARMAMQKVMNDFVMEE